MGKKQSTKGKERAPPYSPPASAFVIPEVKTIPLPMCPKEGKNVLLCMCCTLLSMAEYQKRFISPRPNIQDTTALPTARIVLSKGKSVVDIYTELKNHKAYRTALLTGNEEACQLLADMDKHDNNEVMDMLHKAEEEVITEIKIDQAIGEQDYWRTDVGSSAHPVPIEPFDNVPVTQEGPAHPPIGVEASILNHITDEA
jgi:hypothetical protein